MTTQEQLQNVRDALYHGYCIAAAELYEGELNRIREAIAILDEVKPVEEVTAKDFTHKCYQHAANSDECSIEECIRFLFPNGVKIVEDKITYV